MKFSFTIAAAIAAFSPLASAHMRAVYPPTVWETDFNNNLAPLDPSGSNYPCHDTSGWYDKDRKNAPNPGEFLIKAGEVSKFIIEGTAVHGGGSCQVSITYESAMTKSTVFKVLRSYHGGCPTIAAGNLPEVGFNGKPPQFDVSFKLPETIHGGKAVLAWTWFNNLGNREMYMRCAPVTVQSTVTSPATFNSLPEMFKANIGAVSGGCETPHGTNVRFPNPGTDVVDGGVTLTNPTGNCGSSAPAPAPAPEPTPSPTSTPSPTQPATPTSTPGGFIAVPTSTKAPKPPVETPVQTPPVEKPKPGTPPPATGKCVHNSIVCTSETTWSLCDNGVPKPMGKTAPGLVCKDGTMVRSQPRGRRNVRFSNAHRRRHHATMMKE